MIVERDIVSISGKAFKKNVNPTRTMEIIVFKEIDEGIGMQVEVRYMIEQQEERLGFGARLDFDVVFQKMGPFMRCV